MNYLKNKYLIFRKYNSEISSLYDISILYKMLILSGDCAIFMLLSLIFYNCIIPGILAFPLLLPMYNYHYREIINKRKAHLEHQFKDMLASINSALSTGYSLENATKEAYLEMVSIYGEKSVICKEISIILNQINLGKPVESAYETFSKRCNVDSITTFSEILIIAKRSSGNLSSIIKSTTSTLLLKIDSDREIKSSISSKLFERNIMIFMPLIIIIYVSSSSPGFFDPLYNSLSGRLIMTCCLTIYLFAIWLSSKIFELEDL